MDYRKNGPAVETRRDAVYWQRLRKDRGSNVAVLFTAVAAVVAAVAVTMATVPGTPWGARSSPLYWLILVPVVWWVSSLAAFEPWAVRSWKPLLAALCLAGAACLALALVTAQNVILTATGFTLTQACAAAAVARYRKSLVARGGPAR